MSSERERHWSAVYEQKAVDAVSWYQAAPGVDLAMIRAAALPAGARVIDVGGGASMLVDALLDDGLEPTVLDIAAPALAATRARLGDRASRARFVVADATAWTPDAAYALWHDRAVFHFLVDEPAREAYGRALAAALAPAGHVVVGTFAPDGPERCSGLPVRRWGPDELAAELSRASGRDLEKVQTATERHRTPWGSEQSFAFVHLRDRPPAR